MSWRKANERAFLDGALAVDAFVGSRRFGAGDKATKKDVRLRDSDVDHYIAIVAMHRRMREAHDEMTHAQRCEDGRQALEALEIDVARRAAACYETMRSGTRDLEDALIDLKLTPDVLESFVRRAAVERRMKVVMEAWNLRIRDAVRDAGEDKNSASARAEGMECDAIVSDVAPISEDVIEIDDTIGDASAVASSGVVARAKTAAAPPMDAEIAATRLQSAVRGWLSRTKTRIDAHRELVHLGMELNDELKSQDLRADDAQESKRRIEAMELSERRLAARAAELRAATLATRRDEIKEAIIAEKARAAVESDRSAENSAEGRGALAMDPGSTSAVGDAGDADAAARLSRAIEAYKRAWSEDAVDEFDERRIEIKVLEDVTNEIRVEVDDEARASAAELKGKSKKKKKSTEATNSGATSAKTSGTKKSATKKAKTKSANDGELDEKVICTLARAKALVPTDLNSRLANYVGAGGLRRDTDVGSTMLDITLLKHRLAVSVVLPLTSKVIHENAPHVKCVVLEGAPRSGKSYLTRLCAAESASATFDFSPEVIRAAVGRGESAKTLLKQVFTAAKMSTPSVIVVRDIDRFFPEKSKKSKSDDDLVKLRKDLAKEIKSLKPGARCVVLCTSSATSEPKGFDKFFDLRLVVPLPDYSSRGAIARAALESEALALAPRSIRRVGDFASATSTIHATEGFSSGALFALVRENASILRDERDVWAALGVAAFGVVAKRDLASNPVAVSRDAVAT